jgi:hypothetical protein
VASGFSRTLRILKPVPGSAQRRWVACLGATVKGVTLSWPLQHGCFSRICAFAVWDTSLAADPELFIEDQWTKKE